MQSSIDCVIIKLLQKFPLLKFVLNNYQVDKKDEKWNREICRNRFIDVQHDLSCNDSIIATRVKLNGMPLIIVTESEYSRQVK